VITSALCPPLLAALVQKPSGLIPFSVVLYGTLSHAPCTSGSSPSEQVRARPGQLRRRNGSYARVASCSRSGAAGASWPTRPPCHPPCVWPCDGTTIFVFPFTPTLAHSFARVRSLCSGMALAVSARCTLASQAPPPRCRAAALGELAALVSSVISMRQLEAQLLKLMGFY
jgi:hypothetical protein